MWEPLGTSGLRSGSQLHSCPCLSGSTRETTLRSWQCLTSRRVYVGSRMQRHRALQLTKGPMSMIGMLARLGHLSPANSVPLRSPATTRHGRPSHA